MQNQTRSKQSSTVSAFSKVNFTPGTKAISELHLAAEQGNIKAVRRSLDAGTDVDSVLGKASYRVLHKAVREGSVRMVEFLLREVQISMLGQSTDGLHWTWQLKTKRR